MPKFIHRASVVINVTEMMTVLGLIHGWTEGLSVWSVQVLKFPFTVEKPA